jgi:hypothetical protein
MQQEAAQELHGRQAQALAHLAPGTIAILEADFLCADAHQTIIAEGDPMSVARQILSTCSGPDNGRFRYTTDDVW